MIGSRITFRPAEGPEDILRFGLENAISWAVLVYFIVVLKDTNIEKSGLFAGVCVYIFYMLNQHRRIFVLGLSPSKVSLSGGYCGDDEDFWRFMKETKTSIESLERSFWWRFWIPLIITQVFMIVVPMIPRQ
jgi:hypothetical protein